MRPIRHVTRPSWLIVVAATILSVLAISFFVWPRVVAEQNWQTMRGRGALRVGIDPGRRPFSFYDPSGWQGLDADLAHELASHLNLALTSDPVGYDGIYDALGTHRVDIAVSAIVADPSRMNDFAYSAPYLDTGLRLVAPVTTVVGDLSGQRIAVALGSEADREARRLERRIPKLKRVIVSDESEAFTAIRKGTSDVAIVNGETAIEAGCPHLDNISAEGVAGEPVQYRAVWQCRIVQSVLLVIAMRKDDARLLEEVDRALRTLQADGTLQRLVDKWIRVTS